MCVWVKLIVVCIVMRGKRKSVQLKKNEYKNEKKGNKKVVHTDERPKFILILYFY